MTVRPIALKSRTIRFSTASLGSGGQKLRTCPGTQLRSDCTDETRVQAELAKDGANFAQRNDRLLELEVDQVVITIDLVTKPRHGFELMVQFEDLIQIAKARSVDFQLNHK